jgi:hypothetical protein
MPNRGAAAFVGTRLMMAALFLAAVAPGPPATWPLEVATAAPAGIEESRTAEKATLILEINQFIEWPRSTPLQAGEPFDIGVLGDERLRNSLAKLARSRTVRGHRIRVRGFRNLDEVELCPVLVVGEHKARLLRVIRDHLRYLDPRRAVLTVGEREDFLENGGIIRLIPLAERIAFEVNLAAAAGAGLEISSEMLRLAERVVPVTPAVTAR